LADQFFYFHAGDSRNKRALHN